MNIVNTILFYITSFFLAVVPISQYIEGVIGQPRSFLPHQSATQNDKTISKLIYRSLFKYDIYGTLIPDLAESWAISEDGLVYTIKLKENQPWSDGKKINSDDLIYTAFKVSDLSGVATDKVDDRTVRYTLPNKFSPFLDLLTVGVMQSNSEENFNPLTPVSSGPFKVLTIKRSGPAIREVTLLNISGNKDFRKLAFKYYTNEEELVIGAKLGEIDGFLATSDYELQNFNEYRFPISSVYYALFFNLRNGKLQNLEFRQKLQKVLPVRDIVGERGILVEGPISRSLFTDKSIELNKLDPDFFEDAEEFSVSLTIPDLKQHIEIAEQIKMLWEDKLNAQVEIIKVNPDSIDQEVIKERNFEVLLYGQEVSRDPDRYINWHSTQKEDPGLNLSGFEHVRSDRALEEGRKEIDNEERLVHYSEFQKVIDENVPLVFLYHPHAKYYVSKYIEGIGEKYTFSVSDRFLDFDNWNRIETN